MIKKILPILLVLSACSEEPVNVKSETKTQLERALSTPIDTLEKSKQVEQQLLDAEERRKKEIQ
mgnify:CR=1 FL=1